jgi:hypothetical protein
MDKKRQGRKFKAKKTPRGGGDNLPSLRPWKGVLDLYIEKFKFNGRKKQGATSEQKPPVALIFAFGFTIPGESAIPMDLMSTLWTIK